jgi:cytochrome c553
MKKLSILCQFVLCASLTLVGASAQAADEKGSAQAGQGKVWLCIGCHAIQDYRADYPFVYKVPKIGGQNAAYITAALAAYKTGERKHPTMRAIAGSLSDQDMADIGEYYAAQTATSPRNPLK